MPLPDDDADDDEGPAAACRVSVVARHGGGGDPRFAPVVWNRWGRGGGKFTCRVLFGREVTSRRGTFGHRGLGLGTSLG